VALNTLVAVSVSNGDGGLDVDGGDDGSQGTRLGESGVGVDSGGRGDGGKENGGVLHFERVT
jgi:hypothetical protein